MQHVMNNGALLHTAHGPLQMGLNSVDAKKWAEMKKAPMVAKALKAERLKECEAPKAKAQPKPDAKDAKGK